MIKTIVEKEKKAAREWVVIDADGQILGRLAVKIANLLRGKNKVTFAPHVDNGVGVIVVNARKIRTTGRKLEQKFYTRYSGYPGGLKQTSLEDQLALHPERVIEHAVEGMVPHNRLGRSIMRHLRVYPDAAHPHQAQSHQEKKS